MRLNLPTGYVVEIMEFDRWEQVFEQLSLPEIRKLRDGLNVTVSGKKDELRSLIGGRYYDLLKTGDTIGKMDELGSKEDRLLSELCGPSQFEVSAKNEPMKSREHLACRELGRRVSRVLELELNRGDLQLVLISKCFNLAEELQMNVQRLRQKYDKILEKRLKGEDEGQSSGLFTAYALYKKLSPERVLEDLFTSRKQYIHEVTQTSESLVKALYLMSSAFYISDQSFGRNQLHRLIVQQSQLYTLLESPEFKNKLELDKYGRWVPEQIRKAKCVPQGCIQGIENNGRYTDESKKAFSANQAKFGYETVEIVSQACDELLGQATQLNQLVELYRQILELLRDTKVLRTLHVERGGELFVNVLRDKWVDRFRQIAESLVTTEFDLSQVEDAPSSDIYSVPEFDLNSEESLDHVFQVVHDYSIGRVDQTISSQYESWYNMVLEVKAQIQEAERLKGHVFVVYREDDYDQENDDQWKAQEEAAIVANSQAFDKLVHEQICTVYSQTLHNLERTDATLVFKLRSILQLDHFVQLLGASTQSANVLESLYTQLASSITLDFEQQKGSGMFHTDGQMYLVVRQLRDQLGHDDLLWSHEPGMVIIRNRIQQIVDEKVTDSEQYSTLLSAQNTGALLLPLAI